MIGEWVRRNDNIRSGGILVSNWHLVDSMINNDIVTRCGRRMRAVIKSGAGLEYRGQKPLTRAIGQPQLCHYCDIGE